MGGERVERWEGGTMGDQRGVWPNRPTLYPLTRLQIPMAVRIPCVSSDSLLTPPPPTKFHCVCVLSGCV